MALTLSFYKETEENEWDKFVLEKSMNGVFLQTRKFINYHSKGKFKDVSICVRKGNELVATILGCELNESSGGGNVFLHIEEQLLAELQFQKQFILLLILMS